VTAVFRGKMHIIISSIYQIFLKMFLKLYRS